jgi:hypothetical protein
VFAVEAAGPARWRVDEVVRGERPDGPVRLLRRHFDADGGALGGAAEVGLERSGQRFVYAGGEALLLDLHAAGADVSVAPCPLAARELPPELEGIDLPVASMDLRPGELARSCLVQRDGEWTRWFAPGLGLVREERNGLDGTVRIELCALGSVP